ncbi:uncharacterized protein [Chelonus insularis]|uniref:uncharacterized protein n=1 Tax=Chelonus insularis TaxID=460826 RepID=UPI00158A7B7D|nr:uncharacterized protein LOC118071644 [Chelonus insularis]
MTTRPGDLWQRQRRRSRQALAPIPDMSLSMVSLGSPLVSPNNINNNHEVRDRMSSPWNSSVATSSPDELVIRKRGRRSKTIIYSPECDSKRNSLLSYNQQDRTPTKGDSELHSSIMLREHRSFRKRLELSDDYSESMLTTPEKKNRMLPFHENQFHGNSLGNGLKGLSQEQLVKVIMDLVSRQEQGILSLNNSLREEVMKIIPPADTNPLQEKLRSLHQNISDSIQNFNIISPYLRACSHLEAYLKALKDQGNTLMQSQHWISLMEYVFAAWAITKNLPVWNEDSTSKKCFAHLIHFCKQALIKGNFSHSALEVYAEKMERMINDCEDIKICLQMIREILR